MSDIMFERCGHWMLIHNYNKSQIEKKNVLLSSTKNIVAMATKQETLGIYYGSELLIF